MWQGYWCDSISNFQSYPKGLKSYDAFRVEGWITEMNSLGLPFFKNPTDTGFKKSPLPPEFNVLGGIAYEARLCCPPSGRLDE
ncbi:hypothetical protein VNO80_35206 [Phaseolus coccineus]|uniref:Uncharacterized protein n=1 Tax=Phaseolus coccineus TaxID=3886 RepID=A0AAN9Q4R0_PHACN